MRHVLPLFAVAAGAVIGVIACSSDDSKTPTTPATIAPLGDGGGGDDDDDTSGDAGCGTVKSLDCAKQTAHAKEAGCAKFDEKQWTEDCESENCGTPEACADALKAFGDCLLEQTVVCDEGGDVAKDVPACKEKEGALTNCLLGL
jgi:hypothetical protein